MWFFRICSALLTTTEGRHRERSVAIQLQAAKQFSKVMLLLRNKAWITTVPYGDFVMTIFGRWQWSRVNIVSLLCLCSLATGCGFRPLHVPEPCECRIAVPIKIATIQERDGQILRNYLVDLLTPEGTPSCPRYVLEVSLTDVIADIGVNRDETSHRKRATVTANLQLRDWKTHNIVYTHTTKAINSFSVISQNYFSDLTTEDYAKHEALRLLAEKITLLLTTFLEAENEG